MKLTLEIKSTSDFESLKNKVRAAQIQFLQWQAITVRKLANSMIVDPIQERMRRRDFSPKIIDNTEIFNIEFIRNKIRIFVKSEYFSETGFDVALAREKGTADHDIKPVQKKALMWIQSGQVRFSKGHRVSGMQRFNTIAETIDELTPAFREQYKREEMEWFKENLGATV